MEQNNDIQASLDYITGAGHGDFPPEIEDTIKRVLKSALTAQQPSADAKAALESLREIIDDLKCLSITGELTKNQNEEIETIRAVLTEQPKHPDVNQELVRAQKEIQFWADDSASNAVANAKLKNTNQELLDALKQSRSVMSSLNYKGTKLLYRDDGEGFYGQTPEWCEWVENEILPVVMKAITKAEKQGA